MANFTRGSEWHRWDYHVHTPASWKYSDQGPDAYPKIIAAIEKSGCAAFGINDYATIDGYLELRGKVSKPIFPVVEFRMDQVLREKNSGGPALNFHIIFTNEDAYLDKIKSFIYALTFKDYEDRTRNFTEMDLSDFAKNQIKDGKSETDIKVLAKLALSVARVKFDDILQQLKERQLRDKALILVPFDEYGGVDNLLSQPEQDGLIKTHIIRQADILGSSSEKVRRFFLAPSAKCSEEQFKLWFGRPKPIIKGSDAHDVAHVGVLPKKEDGTELHCWIKSDLTFDGLKQIVYEPEERVVVATNPPHQKDLSKVISSLVIRQSNGWFEDQEIPLNSDLVTIIGGKGSGKTALVDLIAFCGGETDPDKRSFIFKADKELFGTKLLLKWKNGLSDGEVEIAKGLAVPVQAKVRYLSQSFVESLCSYENHEKLETEIENILFQYIPPTAKLGVEKFSSLKELRVQGVQMEMDSLSEQIKRLNAEIFELRTLLSSRAGLAKQRDDTDKEITELHRNKPKAVTPEELKAIEDLKCLMSIRKRLEAEIEALEIKINKLTLLKTKVQMMRDQVSRYNIEMSAILTTIGQADLLPSVSAQFPANTTSIIDTRIAELTRSVRAINGTSGIEPGEGKDTLLKIDEKIEVLNKQCSMESEKQNELKKFNTFIAEKELLRKALEQKIAAIDRDASRGIDEKRGLRKVHFVDFFKKLSEKRQILDGLYQPLNRQELMMEDGRKIEFYARPSFDDSRFVERALEIFHGNKSIIRGKEGFEQLAEGYLDELGPTFLPVDDSQIVAMLKTITDAGDGNKNKPVPEQLRNGKTEKDVEDWLYNLDYFDVKHGIKYDETDLAKLSPGKKGVVLLLIYLTVDKDSRPIIVDQPEENLDNRSVYSTLVKFFRKAKHHRQIIVVTHNPNLVVNGDSEQVIVANYERTASSQPTRIRYIAGAIENSSPFDKQKLNILDAQGVREHICEVLEGGKDAFTEREQKYGFHGASK